MLYINTVEKVFTVVLCVLQLFVTAHNQHLGRWSSLAVANLSGLLADKGKNGASGTRLTYKATQYSCILQFCSLNFHTHVFLHLYKVFIISYFEMEPR